jgi:hypothetical protein
MFVMVGVMYAIMAITVRFGPETRGLSLEDVSEDLAPETDPSSPPTSDTPSHSAHNSSHPTAG